MKQLQRQPREALRRWPICGRQEGGLLGRVSFSDRSPKTVILLLDLVPFEAVFRPLDTLRPERGQPFAMEV
jgi:hypothetical protein